MLDNSDVFFDHAGDLNGRRRTRAIGVAAENAPDDDECGGNQDRRDGRNQPRARVRPANPAGQCLDSLGQGRKRIWDADVHSPKSGQPFAWDVAS
jgi:hypothetical protein